MATPKTYAIAGAFRVALEERLIFKLCSSAQISIAFHGVK